MKYTLNQLEVFLHVVKKESITKASESLFMTQPAVSIQLKNFQDQFDIPLVEIIKRRVHVTEFGHEIAALAEQILNDVATMEYKKAAYKGLTTGKLKIASASTGKYLLPYLLTTYTKQYPSVHLSLDVTNKEQVVKSLLLNQIDFALVSVKPTEMEDLEEELLLENKLYLIQGKEESKTKVDQWIFREVGSATRMAMERYLKEQNIQPENKIELTSNEAVKQAVIAGLGKSIMPLIGLKNELMNGELKIIKTKGLPITTYWRLLWLKDKMLSPAASAFLDNVRKNKKLMMEARFSWYLKFK